MTYQYKREPLFEGATDPDVLAWNLPNEMVIVGDFRDNRCEP
jgi:hypothetical protein